jgi:hypothetical protein
MRIVEIANKSSNEVVDIVNELRDQGLVQGTDFDFAYHPSTLDTFDHVPSKVVFTFHTEKYATLFALRWA